jgi:hypothetical protein
VSNARAAQHPLNRLQQPVRPRHGIPLRGSRREQSQSCSQTHPLACIRPAREPPSSRQAPCLAALRADENSAAARLPKQVRLLRICSRTTPASDGYRSSGGGLVDHAFAAQHRNNLVLTNGAPSSLRSNPLARIALRAAVTLHALCRRTGPSVRRAACDCFEFQTSSVMMADAISLPAWPDSGEVQRGSASVVRFCRGVRSCGSCSFGCSDVPVHRR